MNTGFICRLRNDPMNSGLLSSNVLSWTTPRDFYNWLNDRFQFTLDPCATEDNALCKKFYTPVDDGLIQSWKGERVFMNPPYGREIGKWVKKAFIEGAKGALVVGLVPARTDTQWWHDYIMNKAQVIYIKGRLRFGGSKINAPFPCAICIWWGSDIIGSW